jgi:hypothetical protein
VVFARIPATKIVTGPPSEAAETFDVFRPYCVSVPNSTNTLDPTGGCTVYFATSGFFVAATGELADDVFFPPQPAEIKEKARETTRQTLQRANSIRLFQERSISPESNWTFPVVTKMSF